MRRQIIEVILLFISTTAGAQDAALPSGVYPVTRIESAPRSDLREISPGRFAAIGSAVSIDDIQIYSVSNGNDRYSALARNKGRACSSALLQLQAQIIVSTGYGSDPEGCSVNFLLTPAQAARAADLFQTVRQDRHEIGKDVTAVFSGSDTRELIIRISNPPNSTPVQWQRGGRNRGPRDNQFSMRITRNGSVLPAIHGDDLGGLSSMLTLNPGGQAEVRAPISSWGDISMPGHYVIEAAYETVLTPAGDFSLNSPGRRGDVWVRRFEGTISFDVR